MGSTPVHAWRNLVEALGLGRDEAAQTVAERCAKLWTHTLLAASGRTRAPRTRLLPSDSGSPVVIRGLGFHLVCPHHLTVAFGHAELGYLPRGGLLSLGDASRLLAFATQRATLQEDAADRLAAALHQAVRGPCLVRMTGQHPCHRLSEPRAHDSECLTHGSRGTIEEVERLYAVLNSSSAPPTP